MSNLRTSPEMVVVKAFGGIALVRWMVGTVANVAVITNEEGAESVRAGREPSAMVGFPLSDVYKLDRSAGITDGDTPDWSTLVTRF